MIKFITKKGRLELVIDPAYYEIVAGKRIKHEGKRVIFLDGKFETDDKEKIEFLLKHRYFNKVFYLQGKLNICEYCGKFMKLKASKITHEKWCEKNPNKKKRKEE